MGQKDITEKILADYNDIFADIVNVLLFHGEETVKEDELQDQNTVSMYKAENTIHEQERDVSKVWKKGEVKISIFGLEHQTKKDVLMPLRVIGYDGISYRSQCLSDAKEYYPVITLVLNFSNTRWDKNKRLSECFHVPQELEPYFSDYKINVFDIAYLSETEVSLFKSDFRIVADYFVQVRTNKTYKPDKATIKHIDEVLKLMSVLTEDVRFEEVQKSGRKVMNMCQVIDEFEAVGERRGEIKGEIKVLYFRLNKKPVEIADEMNLSVNEVQSIIDKILSEKKDNSENE